MTLQEFSKRFSAFGRGIRKEVRTFLPRERGRYERIYREAIRTSVYDASSPVSYVRTGGLLRSARAYLPEPSNPLLLFIDSNPSDVPAKLDYIRDGYAQFVAGEGPGIGFLERTVPDLFPKPFHDIAFQIIENEAHQRFAARIDKQIAKL